MNFNSKYSWSSSTFGWYRASNPPVPTTLFFMDSMSRCLAIALSLGSVGTACPLPAVVCHCQSNAVMAMCTRSKLNLSMTSSIINNRSSMGLSWVECVESTRVVKGWPRTLQCGYNEHVSCRDLLASSLFNRGFRWFSGNHRDNNDEARGVRPHLT